MSEGKKRTAGILVMSMWLGKFVAVLLRRGKINHETMCDEKFRGGCQITAHGKLNEGEDSWLGAFKELEEEVGVDAAQEIFVGRQNLNNCHWVWEKEDETETANVSSFIIYVPNARFVSLTKFNGSAGGFEMLTEDRVQDIKNLREFDKVVGVTDLNTVAMFPDESALVKKGFELIRELPKP